MDPKVKQALKIYYSSRQAVTDTDGEAYEPSTYMDAVLKRRRKKKKIPVKPIDQADEPVDVNAGE